MNSSPLVPQPRRESTSSSSQRGPPSYDSEDQRRSSIGGGSLPRRLRKHGSQASMQSHDSSQNLPGGVKYRHSPVNIPAGSLPARMVVRQSTSLASTESSTGAGGGNPALPYPTSFGSPSARRLSTLQPPSYPDPRSSWQTSPAMHSAAPAFTPPSAGFSLGKPAADGWRQEQPPFCTTPMVAIQPAVNSNPLDHAGFHSQTPPFRVDSDVPSNQLSPSAVSSALPLVRRASMTFAATSVAEGHHNFNSLSVFTPSSSATGRPHLLGGLDIPPLANLGTALEALSHASQHARASPDGAELGEFFRTLERNRQRLEAPSHGGSVTGDGNTDSPASNRALPTPAPSAAKSVSLADGNSAIQSTSPATNASRTRLALARFRELNEMNTSFSESLSQMAASQYLDQSSHPRSVPYESSGQREGPEHKETYGVDWHTGYGEATGNRYENHGPREANSTRDRSGERYFVPLEGKLRHLETQDQERRTSGRTAQYQLPSSSLPSSRHVQEPSHVHDLEYHSLATRGYATPDYHTYKGRQSQHEQQLPRAFSDQSHDVHSKAPTRSLRGSGGSGDPQDLDRQPGRPPGDLDYHTDQHHDDGGHHQQGLTQERRHTGYESSSSSSSLQQHASHHHNHSRRTHDDLQDPTMHLDQRGELRGGQEQRIHQELLAAQETHQQSLQPQHPHQLLYASSRGRRSLNRHERHQNPSDEDEELLFEMSGLDLLEGR
ncbi:hypothetical protein HKX48_001329 [Thoreauomyces humboldtii]|nr:hypothetical protein HKX48_001329 [Thoreauomyces humboldtii]